MRNYTIKNGITLEKINNNLHLFVKTDKPNSKISQAPEVLKMRLNGLTFDRIGKILNLSRERIRQIEAKGVMYLSDEYKEQEKRIKERPLDYSLLIDELPLSNRLKNVLAKGRIRTLAGLLRTKKRDFLEIDGFGCKLLNETKDYFNSRNIVLE